LIVNLFLTTQQKGNKKGFMSEERIIRINKVLIEYFFGKSCGLSKDKGIAIEQIQTKISDDVYNVLCVNLQVTEVKKRLQKK
jgi:hypothetical protein